MPLRGWPMAPSAKFFGEQRTELQNPAAYRLEGDIHPALGIHSGPMHRTDLVARWIAQVGKIDLARRPFAPTRRILDALATIGDTSVVEGPGFLGAVAREANSAAVGVRRRGLIDWLGDAEHASFRAIEDPALRIGMALGDADGAQHGVVEFLGRGDIVGADHHV